MSQALCSRRSAFRVSPWFFGLCLCAVLPSLAAPKSGALQTITLNELVFKNAPAELSASTVQKVVDRISGILEWSIRKIEIDWIRNESQFIRLHRFGPNIFAFTRKKEGQIYLGPRTTMKNFEGVLGHELVHVIIHQKYAGKVPAWLEEGMANQIAGNTDLSYRWLALQDPLTLDQMSHPFGSQNLTEVKRRYMSSLAFTQMLQSRCGDFRELLNLSLKSKMEDFFQTYCQIGDPMAALHEWIQKKARQ